MGASGLKTVFDIGQLLPLRPVSLQPFQLVGSCAGTIDICVRRCGPDPIRTFALRQAWIAGGITSSQVRIIRSSATTISRHLTIPNDGI